MVWEFPVASGQRWLWFLSHSGVMRDPAWRFEIGWFELKDMFTPFGILYWWPLEVMDVSSIIKNPKVIK